MLGIENTRLSTTERLQRLEDFLSIWPLRITYKGCCIVTTKHGAYLESDSLQKRKSLVESQRGDLLDPSFLHHLYKGIEDLYRRKEKKKIDKQFTLFHR